MGRWGPLGGLAGAVDRGGRQGDGYRRTGWKGARGLEGRVERRGTGPVERETKASRGQEKTPKDADIYLQRTIPRLGMERNTG